MAIIPEYLTKINSVIRYIENPCQAPWKVYLELAKEPAGEAILQLVMPSVADVARAWARPRGIPPLRFVNGTGKRQTFGGSHGRIGRNIAKGSANRVIANKRRGIPDTSELIARMLPGYGAAKAATYGKGVKYAWMIDGAIQQGLWYWLVADVTINFFYNWTSAIMKSEYCSKAGYGQGGWSGGPGRIVSGTGSLMGPFTGRYATGGVRFGVLPGDMVVDPPRQCTISYSGRFTSQFNADNVSCDIVLYVNGRDVASHTLTRDSWTPGRDDSFADWMDTGRENVSTVALRAFKRGGNFWPAGYTFSDLNIMAHPLE